MKTKKAKLLPKIKSLGELRMLATASPSYLQLAICGAENLGGHVVGQVENMQPGDTAYKATLASAMRILDLNANETDERGVVAEVNFVRDCVK